jgi:hypothetical protein
MSTVNQRISEAGQEKFGGSIVEYKLRYDEDV